MAGALVKDELLTTLLEQDIGLRDAKYAVTRYRILEYFTLKMDDSELSSKSITQICNELGISKSTFFNYFSKIEDVFLYQLQIWFYKIISELIEVEAQYDSKALLIEAMNRFAEVFDQNPSYMKFFLFSANGEAVKSEVLKALTEAECILLGLTYNFDFQPMLSAKPLIDIVYRKAVAEGSIENDLTFESFSMFLHMILVGGVSFSSIHKEKSLKTVFLTGVDHFIFNIQG